MFQINRVKPSVPSQYFSIPFLLIFLFILFFFPLCVWAGFLTWVCGVLLFACSLWCGFPQGSVLPVITAVPMVITDTLSQNKHVGMFIYGGPHSESTVGFALVCLFTDKQERSLSSCFQKHIIGACYSFSSYLGIFINFLKWSKKHPSSNHSDQAKKYIEHFNNHLGTT